jgi:hypothetical protein
MSLAIPEHQAAREVVLMTAKELLDRLLLAQKCNPRTFNDLTVAVRDFVPSAGPLASVEVVDVYQGIDWNSDKLFLLTEKPMVVKGAQK